SRHRPASRPVHTRIIHGSSASVAPAPVTSGCSRQRDARLGRAGLRESAGASRVCLGWRVVRALLPGAPGGHALTLRRSALLWSPRIALGVPWYLWPFAEWREQDLTGGLKLVPEPFQDRKGGYALDIWDLLGPTAFGYPATLSVAGYNEGNTFFATARSPLRG